MVCSQEAEVAEDEEDEDEVVRDYGAPEASNILHYPQVEEDLEATRVCRGL